MWLHGHKILRLKNLFEWVSFCYPQIRRGTSYLPFDLAFKVYAMNLRYWISYRKPPKFFGKNNVSDSEIAAPGYDYLG